MQYDYKQVKEYVPHCPICGERLRGNGSDAFPYKCKCGTWKPRGFMQPGEYDIVKDSK